MPTTATSTTTQTCDIGFHPFTGEAMEGPADWRGGA